MRFEYRYAEMEVPASPAILLVPSKVGIDVFGRVTSSAGSCIKPPPPATASINPATNEKQANDIMGINP